MLRRPHAALRRVAALAILLAVGGCAADRPAAIDPGSGAPEDMVVDVEVRVGRRVEARDGVAYRAARYLLLPDATLHVGGPDGRGETGAVGPYDARGGSDHRPGVVRRLEASDVARLRERCRELVDALDEPSVPESDRRTWTPRPGERVWLATLHGGGDTRTWAWRAAAGEPAPPAAAALVQLMAALAWADDDLAARSIVSPRRYDLGPDPWARYRAPASLPESRVETEQNP